jgi:sugar lactone lactonase YvrE
MLPLILPLHFSFQPSCARLRRADGAKSAADVSDIAQATIEDILNQNTQVEPHFRTVWCNEQRLVQSIALPPLSSDQRAYHVSVDSDGLLYVCGIIADVIRVYDRAGAVQTDVRISFSGRQLPVQKLSATAHDYSRGTIYVSDADAAAVHCISKSGEVLFSSPAGAVSKPLAVAVCGNSRRVAVADEKSVKVLHAHDLTPIAVLSRSTTHVSAVLLDGCRDFSRCVGVAFDANGFLYSLDAVLNCVVVFDRCYVNIATFGSSGQNDGQFIAAKGLCIDGTGKVFISDDSRIQLFDRMGRHLVSFEPGSLHKQLTWSCLGSICVDRKGRLLVCSHGTSSLLRLF